MSKKKTRYYYDAFIAKSHRDIMQFTFLYTVITAGDLRP